MKHDLHCQVQVIDCSDVIIRRWEEKGKENKCVLLIPILYDAMAWHNSLTI